MSVKLPYVKPGSVWKANGETGFVWKTNGETGFVKEKKV